MSKSITPLTLRLPERLKEDLENCAQRNDRSINKELAARLRKSFEIELSQQERKRLNQELPTVGNDCTLGIRLPIELKELCSVTANKSKTSLNQEIVIRLHVTHEPVLEAEHIKSTGKTSGVNESLLLSFEEHELLRSFNALSKINKKAVMNLIRNLSD